MADAKRLIALGLPVELAKEIARQIDEAGQGGGGDNGSNGSNGSNGGSE